MKVAHLLDQNGIGIDDVRWYLSSIFAARLLEYRTRPAELARFIWSGKLEAELYDAEERFVEELQRRTDAGSMDEAALREVMREIAAEKRRRKG
jgi:hypothetical protein